MAELHVVGEIVGASGFSSKDIFCKASPENECASLVMPLLQQTAQHACSMLPKWVLRISRLVQGNEPVTSAAVPISCACLMQWGLACGRAWEHLEGETSGQTQTATGRSPVWAHPVDAHFICKVCLATVPD